MDETARIAMLARTLGASAAGLKVGIGDDAAVLETPVGSPLIVWTIDEQVEGVHFRRDMLSWRDVGWRSVMAAASDVAAMGARPWGALCALVLPDDVDDAALESIACGQRDATAELGAPVVGGNLSRGPALSLATTFLGTTARAVPRSAGRPGDGVWLAGRVGLAAAGLRALSAGLGGDRRLQTAIESWRRPRALVEQGLVMARVASAAVDVSDGLARDAGHIAGASGVCIVLHEQALTTDAGLVEAAAALGASALELALYGGEDYALVVTSPEPIEGFRLVGEVTEGQGIALRGPTGDHRIEPRGFDHFGS